MELYCPGGQSEQLVEFVPEVNEPGEQRKHGLKPETEKLPGAHWPVVCTEVQALEPGLLDEDPKGHDVHAELPCEE